MVSPLLNSFLVRINLGWVLIFFVMMVYGYFGAMTPSYKSLINFEIASIVVFFTPLIAITLIYKLFIKNDNQNAVSTKEMGKIVIQELSILSGK